MNAHLQEGSGRNSRPGPARAADLSWRRGPRMREGGGKGHSVVTVLRSQWRGLHHERLRCNKVVRDSGEAGYTVAIYPSHRLDRTCAMSMQRAAPTRIIENSTTRCGQSRSATHLEARDAQLQRLVLGDPRRLRDLRRLQLRLWTSQRAWQD